MIDMAMIPKHKFLSLMARELQEYRGSLIITPIVIGAAFTVLLLLSIVFAGRLVLLGGDFATLLAGDTAGKSVSIDLSIGDAESGPDFPAAAIVVEDVLGGPVQPLTVTEAPEAIAEEEWNFSREWNFSAPRRTSEARAGAEELKEAETLGTVFTALHALFLLALLAVTVNYLLGCLYDDRKDRSILFWKSMPVSEVEEVLAKLAVAAIAAPAIYLLVSWATQVILTGLAAVLVWRMDSSPTDVLADVSFVGLALQQFSGMLVLIMFVVPTYAWFMLTSAFARRSPFLLAVAIPAGLMIAEQLLFGTKHLMFMISNHVPRMNDSSDAASLGFYALGPVWSSLDYLGMVLGWGVTAMFLAGAVWLRRYRFEI